MSARREALPAGPACRTMAYVALAAFTTLGNPAGAPAQFAAGQVPNPVPPSLELNVRGGGSFFPTSLVTFDELSVGLARSITYGGSMGARWGMASVEVVALWVPADLVATFDGISAAIDHDLTIVTADLLYNFAPRGPFEPFLAAGVGAKIYRASDQTSSTRPTDATLGVGGGMRYSLSRTFALRADVRDYISAYRPDTPSGRSRTQHDILFTVGISARL